MKKKITIEVEMSGHEQYTEDQINDTVAHQEEKKKLREKEKKKNSHPFHENACYIEYNCYLCSVELLNGQDNERILC